MTKAPAAKGLVVRRMLPLRTRNFRYWRAIHPFSDRIIQPFNSSVDNVVAGMKERVFFLDEKGTRKPPCQRRHEELARYAARVAECVGVCARVSGAEYLSTRSGPKRTMYEAALAKMRDTKPTLKELAELGYFVKTEGTQHQKRQVPRIISPRSYGFNYLLGRYTVAVEHKIFDALACLFTGTPVIAKGLTQQRKAELIVEKLKPGYVCVGLDASRFDQTIGEQLLQAEHHLYKLLFPGDKLLRDLLAMQLDNRGRARCNDGTVKAYIGAMRCSGDQNTSLGNCVVSCMLAAAYYAENGLVGCDILNDGDDLLMFVPKTQLHRLKNLSEWYLEWGLRMKVEDPAEEPEDVEFCQGKPVYGPDGWVLVRDYRKVFNTDYSGNSAIDSFDKYLVHIRNVGLCGMSMAAGIPVLQEYHMLGIRCGKTGKWNTDFTGRAYQMKIQQRAGCLTARRVVATATRISFEKAFGLTPPMQEAIEEEIASWQLAAQPLDIRPDLILKRND